MKTPFIFTSKVYVFIAVSTLALAGCSGGGGGGGVDSYTVSQTVKINSASASNQPINSGDSTDSLDVSLSGSYTGDALGTDYSVHVWDGNADKGEATLGDSDKTWKWSLANLDPGEHHFTAVVVRKSDSAKGTPSADYTVNLGNSVSASSSKPPMWDEFTLTLSKVWANVKRVVYTFTDTASDMADSITTKTAHLVSNVWDSVTTAFTSSGDKTITAEFFDQANGQGKQVNIKTMQLKVGLASVSQPSISAVLDDSNTNIVDSTTTNTKPTISGTVSLADLARKPMSCKICTGVLYSMDII